MIDDDRYEFTRNIELAKLPELPEDIVDLMMEYKPKCAHCNNFILMSHKAWFQPGVICLKCQEKIILRRLKHLGFTK